MRVCVCVCEREREKEGEREHQSGMFYEPLWKKCSCSITPISPVLVSLIVEYLYFIPEICGAGLECSDLWFLSERHRNTFDTNHRVHILV